MVQIKEAQKAMISKIKRSVAEMELAIKNTSQKWNEMHIHLKQLYFELDLLTPSKNPIK
jgi:hypothetical protein